MKVQSLEKESMIAKTMTMLILWMDSVDLPSKAFVERSSEKIGDILSRASSHLLVFPSS